MPPRRMGRPGLVGTMARTAVVAGTANATVNAMNRRSAGKQQQAADAAAYEQQQQMAQMQAMQAAQAQAAAPPAEDPAMAKLKELASLHAAGILSDEEFAAAKAKALGI